MNIILKDPLKAKVMVDIWANSMQLGKENEVNELREIYEKYRDYLMILLNEGIEKGEINGAYGLDYEF